MSGAAFLRIKKLTGSGIMLKAARHNRRAIQAEMGAAGPIDPTRSHLNVTLMGASSADEVARLAKSKISAAGISKPRKNAVVGVELVFSLPAGHGHDVTHYFTACANWAGHEFGGIDNIVSADVHRDEAQDHAHVLLVPLFQGRLRGSDAVGNKRKLSELQSKFFKDVAAGFGFSKPRSRLSGNNKAQVVRQVLEKLRQDPAAKSAAYPAIRDSVERDPLHFALVLGIAITDQPPKPCKTTAQIFTSKGKGPRKEKPIGFQTTKPYRVSDSPGPQTLGLCRGSLSPAQHDTEGAPAIDWRINKPGLTAEPSDLKPEPEPPAIDQTVRIRETDFTPDCYDPETGEFYKPPTARRTPKHGAD